MANFTESIIITDGFPGLPAQTTIPLPSEPITDDEAAFVKAFVPGGEISAEVSGLVTVVSGGVQFALAESALIGDSALASYSQTKIVPVAGVLLMALKLYIGSGKSFNGTYKGVIA